MTVRINVQLSDGTDASAEGVAVPGVGPSLHGFDGPDPGYPAHIDELIVRAEDGSEITNLPQSEWNRIEERMLEAASERAEGEFWERGEHLRSLKLESREIGGKS